MVKNLPSNAGDESSTPSQGTKIPHAEGPLSPRATTTEQHPTLATAGESPRAAARAQPAATRAQLRPTAAHGGAGQGPLPAEATKAHTAVANSGPVEGPAKPLCP